MLIDLNKLFSITETLRMQTIGDPVWLPQKNVFEYANQSVQVVAVLKAIRAAQGVKSMHILCENGLLIDMGAIYRCVADCSSEIYFLLEHYPQSSEDVDRFVKAFFETTIDNYSNVQTNYVPVRKIHNAETRILTSLENGAKNRNETAKKVYKAFSGYIHANYSHIMQNCSGTPPDINFNLAGVPSIQERTKHMQLVDEAYSSVLCSIGFASHKFGLTDLYREIVHLL